MAGSMFAVLRKRSFRFNFPLIRTKSICGQISVLLLFLSAFGIAQEIREALPVDSSPDDQARFLAGIPLNASSPLAPLQGGSAYLEHLIQFGRAWSRFRDNHFDPKRVWVSEVRALFPRKKTLYYLFSGPDFINASAMFPDVETFILVGLEPVGEVFPPEKLDDAQISTGLAALRKATETTLQFSYFITKDMKQDLDRAEFRGVLPILYTFLAFPGYRISETQLVSLDEHGVLHQKEGEKMPGVRIRFSEPGSGAQKTIYYFRGDLSDSGLGGESAGLLKWLLSQPRGEAYLKAASYLLHESYFSKARNFLLGHSDSILQDDSGIPFRFFSPDTWNLFLFGKYTRPIEIFDTKFQPELRRAFETDSTVRPLPFGTGYQWRPGESNLMLAVRKSAVPRAEAVSPVSP